MDRRHRRSPWVVGAVAALLVTGCGDTGAVARRCRELEPKVTAKTAWEDIDGMQDAVEEWLRLDCEQVLGHRAGQP